MAITPAHRVSMILRKNGMNPGSLESTREATKVTNRGGPADLKVNRYHGSAVVAVRCHFSTDSIAERHVATVIEILTAHGYRAELSSPTNHTVNVWEPNWRAYVGREIPFKIAGVVMDPDGWRADKLRDGRILAHLASCPSVPTGKSIPVTGRTREDIANDAIRGGLLKGMGDDGSRLAKLVNLHTCITSKED